MAFVLTSLPRGTRILDLGAANKLGSAMRELGYEIVNTDFDLDEFPERARSYTADATTAFEILEHLVAPLNILRELPTQRLFATVPTRLWFARAYRNMADPWDQHFHEFEPWQFDLLVEKAGWRILRRERWTSPVLTPGIRPLLRLFARRYYAIEAVRARDESHRSSASGR